MSLIIFAIILRITSNSALNAMQKSLSNAFSPLNTNFKTYFLLSLFCLPLFFIHYFDKINPQLIFLAVTGGIFGTCANAFLISALKHGELSVLAPINSYKAIVGLVFGIILLGEIPDLKAIFGIILIIFGSFIIFDTVEEKCTLALFKRKDIRFRILALIFSAIEAVLIKKTIILSDICCSFYLWAIFGFVFSYILLKINKEKIFSIKHEFKKHIPPFIFLSFLVFLMQFSTNFVFEKIPVASALSLFQLSNILSIFLGYKFFKEKNITKKLVGSIIMILGTVIILRG